MTQYGLLLRGKVERLTRTFTIHLNHNINKKKNQTGKIHINTLQQLNRLLKGRIVKKEITFNKKRCFVIALGKKFRPLV